jgi:hypothetical protein
MSDFVDDIRLKGEQTPMGETSPKGARAQMQVLPSTAAAPGFGVRPVLDQSNAEYNRVGADYARALLAKYGGNRVLASAAYNAGPGRVDQWIRQFGDPRTGQISEADWMQKIPFDETRGYAKRVTGGAGAAQQGPPPAGPSLVMPGAPPPRPFVSQENMLTAELAPAAPDPVQQYLHLAALLPPTHGLQPVDYDPWAIQRAGTGR